MRGFSLTSRFEHAAFNKLSQVTLGRRTRSLRNCNVFAQIEIALEVAENPPQHLPLTRVKGIVAMRFPELRCLVCSVYGSLDRKSVV